jgi:hypothetical protein
MSADSKKHGKLKYWMCKESPLLVTYEEVLHKQTEEGGRKREIEEKKNQWVEQYRRKIGKMNPSGEDDAGSKHRYGKGDGSDKSSRNSGEEGEEDNSSDKGGSSSSGQESDSDSDSDATEQEMTTKKD